MAKKDLRAQMDAARAAAAYIGAAQEDLAAPERGISPSGSSARSSEKDGAKAAPRRSRTHEVRSASLDVTQAAAMPDFFAEDYTEEPRCEAIPSVSYGIASRRSRTHEVRSASLDVTQAAAMPDFFAEDYTEEPRCEAIPSVSYGIASVLAASDAAGTAEAADAAGMVEAADTAGMVEVAGAAGTAEIAGAAGTTETADAAAAAVEDADAPSRAAGASRAAARTRKPRKKSVAEIAGAAGTTETADAAAAAVEDADAPSRAAGASRAAARTRKPRKKSVEAEPPVQAGEGTSGRMTAQVRVPMTAEQREHADLLASVMKITRAEVMRQALDEYWESHKSDLQAAVAACEALTKSS